MKNIGLRHDVVMKDDIEYLLFYDIDQQELKQHELEQIDAMMKLHCLSYILYKTKNGYHVVGLTPMNVFTWASIFGAFKGVFHSYYGGIIIRLSRKPDEQQVLIQLEESYGEVIPNLYNLFCSRFNLQKKPWIKETSKHLLVFEKYRTEKI